MKDFLKSFTTFSRTERMGLIGLISLLLVLLAVRVSMHYWVKPYHDGEKEKEVVAAWQKFKKEHTDSTDSKYVPYNNTLADSLDHHK